MSKAIVDALAERLSERKVIVFSRASLAILLALVLCSWAFIALRLNQSSVGVWDHMFGAPAAVSHIELGKPKAIRSDEWNTLTPWVLSQVAHHYPAENDNIGAGWSAGLMGTPLLDATTPAQPKFWGFHWLPLEYGFSWSWAWKTFATAIALFLLLLALGQNRIGLAAAGALWIYGSSFTQWWFSNGLPEMVAAWALSILGALYLLRSQSRTGIVVGGVLVAFAVCNMATYLYPAFQYPLMVLAFMILAGVTLERGGIAQVREHLGLRALVGLAAVLAICAFWYRFLQAALPTVKLVMDTEYPGHRVSLGGDLSWFRVFDGFFEGFRRGDQKFPLPPTNASEASGFVLMFPFIMLLVPIRAWLRRDHMLIVGLVVYCLFVLGWMVLPLPEGISHAIAATGWSLSPPIRSLVGLGVGSIVLTIVVAARIIEGSLPVYRHSYLVAAGAGLLVAFYGAHLHGIDPTFFHMKKIAIGAIAVIAIAWGVAGRRTWMVAVGVVIFVCQPLQVNPLLQGLSPVLQKPVLVAAERATDRPGDKWMVVGSFILSQGLKAKGLDVVTGSEYYPDTETIEALDPTGRSKKIWNRYAHIVVASEPGVPAPALSLVQADMYLVKIDICGVVPQRLGATLVAYSTAVPKEDLRCLQELPTDPGSGVSLYRFKS